VVVSRDSSITIYKNKEVNYLKQIATEKENSKLWEKQYIQMQDKYTREKSKRKLERLGSIVISGLLGYLYISK
jgi:hypothetical protein